MAVLRALIFSSLLPLASSAADPLTRLADLRALSAAEAEQGRPVHIIGTVMGLNPAAPFHFFLHDGTAGCFIKTVQGGRPENLRAGDRVRVRGFSDPLGYYPSVRDAKVEILGKGALPKPARPIAGEMFSPQLDSEWVEVPAVVTGYEAGDDRLTLAVEVYGLDFKAELPLTPDVELGAAALMQRPARLRGIMGTIFNRQRQMTDRHFFVPSLASITPTLSHNDGENAPLLGVAQLLTGGYGPSILVRLRGVITQQDPKGFYLRDASGSTLVQAAFATHFRPGVTVEVEGFGGVAPFRPVLRATRVSDLGNSAGIQPQHFDPGTDDLATMHAEWVTLDADFLGSREGPFESVLQFSGGGRFFEALLPNKNRHGAKPPSPGDHVRLNGICQLTTTHALPRLDWVDGFLIHLPDAGGITVLHRAPWWNSRRLLGALGLMSGIAAIGVLGTWTLRRQVKRQMAVISEKLRSEAVGEERDRMARELHDTLEQQLSGVALQLDGLDYTVKQNPQNPAAAESSLALARRMLRYTRLEARRSVWDLRSRVLERDGLPAALRAIGESGGETGPVVTVNVSGSERALPAGLDFHLLRIAQEAATNAVKHGAAHSIRIALDYLPDQAILTVQDDGRGFDPAAAQSPGPHFGMLGMRERAAKIGGDFVVLSGPGEGCTVKLAVSLNQNSKTP